jgi:hypothetical protein
MILDFSAIGLDFHEPHRHVTICTLGMRGESRRFFYEIGKALGQFVAFGKLEPTRLGRQKFIPDESVGSVESTLSRLERALVAM